MGGASALTFEGDGGVVRNTLFKKNRGIFSVPKLTLGATVGAHAAALYFLNWEKKTPNIPPRVGDYREAMPTFRSGIVEGCIFRENEQPTQGGGVRNWAIPGQPGATRLQNMPSMRRWDAPAELPEHVRR